MAEPKKEKTRLEFLQMEENWYVTTIAEYEREIEIYKKDLIRTRKKIKSEIKNPSNKIYSV